MSKEQLIVCKTDKGHFAVRPIKWAGMWDKDGNIKEYGLNHVAIFAYERDAKEYIDFVNNNQKYDSDCISRQKLVKELFYSANGSAYPMRDCDNFPITISYEELRKVIHNQPQVQPIVRSVEEIADTFLNVTDCDLCIIKSKCNTKNGELVGRKTCKKMWIDWITGKEV